MKDVDIADVRNFVLLGHTHSGKTTLADAFLHQLDLTQTMGQVDDGTSLLDTADEVKERNIYQYIIQVHHLQFGIIMV